MRTKTLLLTAAVVAAGALSSMAQSVFSVNVVGYINLTILPGYNLVANQLDNTANGGNGINLVLTNGTIPDSTFMQTFNTGIADFDQAQTFFNGLGWVDGSFNPSTNTVGPGQGFFINNPGSTFTLTLVGTVLQGTNTVTVHPGYNFISDPAPVLSDLQTNGFPALADSSTFQIFTNGDYSQALSYFNGLGWVDGSFNSVDPLANVGQGFVIFNSGSLTPWARAFTVQ
jgi:hypothetical protein